MLVEVVVSRLVVLLTSVAVITHSARRVVQQERDGLKLQDEYGQQTLSWVHVVTFPIVGSAVLLILFYLFEYIQFVFTLLTILMSVGAMFSFILPFIKHVTDKWTEKQRRLLSWVWCHRELMDVDMLLSGVLSLTLTMLWVTSGHWILLDLVGVAISVFMIQFVRVPSLKLSSVFLMALLLYDIFWVFFSSSVFDANVMVEVATKKARNPVAVMGDTLNMPDIVKSRPPLSLPGKLLVPSSFDGENYTILGLGLVLASIVADVFDSPQPALLYLVPCVLTPFLLKAFLQGDFAVLWNGPFNEHSSLPV